MPEENLPVNRLRAGGLRAVSALCRTACRRCANSLPSTRKCRLNIFQTAFSVLFEILNQRADSPAVIRRRRAIHCFQSTLPLHAIFFDTLVECDLMDARKTRRSNHNGVFNAHRTQGFRVCQRDTGIVQRHDRPASRRLISAYARKRILPFAKSLQFGKRLVLRRIFFCCLNLQNIVRILRILPNGEITVSIGSLCRRSHQAEYRYCRHPFYHHKLLTFRPNSAAL